ncbi:hypothetical protein ACFLRF_02695 [Candidatus Altiarchaeota archaeon]
MPARKFSKQTPEQILKHLKHFLRDDCRYRLYIDSIGVHFRIDEQFSTGRKQDRARPKDWEDLSKKQKKKCAAKKSRSNPKIRTRKMGRTVSLKGWGEAKKK